MVENDLLMQFQSNILAMPVVRANTTETTALGAAYGAGLGVGYFSSLDELRQRWRAARTWSPRGSTEERHSLIARWHQAVQRSFGWVR
jgi:glycerol kinase